MPIKIAFVHTPMATSVVPERELFWRTFDRQYHAAHPGLRHMKKPLWELPHWMTWLGGVLTANGFEDLDVLDLFWSADGLATLNEELAREAIVNCPADVYLLSPMTPNLPLALEIAGMIKQTHASAKVIFGGVVATPLCEEIAADARVDIVVVGRAEIALPSLLRALDKHESLDSVGNLALQSASGKVQLSGWKYPPVAPANIPEPKIDMFPTEEGENLRYLRQVYGLGCPYDCAFCTIQTIKQNQSFFPVDRVLQEIRAYREHYGEHHNVYFGDETFALDHTRTETLCAALESDGTIGYDCQTRLRCLTDNKTRQMLRRSGCRWVEIGLETKAQSTQDTFKQRQKIVETENILSQTRDDGLATCAFMVNGFPDQTLDAMKSAVDWVCELIHRDLLCASYFATLVPYPGTGLYLRQDQFGIKIHHHRYELYNEDLPPVFDSTHATSDQIYRVFLEGLTMIGQAMNKSTRGTSAGYEQSTESYGQFWASSHI